MELDQAKVMLIEDLKFKTCWKFDHLWNIIKNFEKFKDGAISARQVSPSPCFGYVSSESKNLTPDSATQTSPGLSSCSLNLHDDDDIIGGSLSQRPTGAKKSKLKRKTNDQTSTVINTLEEGISQLLVQLKKTTAQRQHHLKMNYALKELKEENIILF